MRLRGRGIAPGHAAGSALAIPGPFSFVGGVDPATGTIIDPSAGLSGERLAGRVFAFPHGKGSTVGSYVIYGLAKRGAGPAAIVNSAADGIVVVGAILGEIPMVDRIDIGGLLTGDRILVDGDRGTVEIPDVRSNAVVSVVLRNRGRILIVRRSGSVATFQGRWSVISGYLEGREDPRSRAVREVREETGMRGIRFRAKAAPLYARDQSAMFEVHPFLFDAPTRRIRLDWENVEYRWIRPEEVDRFQTVPRLKDVVTALVKPEGASR
jgi:predicted aconitase with swiveling domain